MIVSATIRLPSGPGLPAHLATCLQCVSARSVQITGHRVSFEGGILRMVDNWNLLVPFGSGAVSIDAMHRRLCYQLDARQLLVFASALPVLPMVVAVANSAANAHSNSHSKTPPTHRRISTRSSLLGSARHARKCS